MTDETIHPADFDARFAQLRDSATALLGAAREEGDWDLIDEMRKLALNILRQASRGNSRGIEVALTVEWHTGCSCHGSDHSEKLTAETPTALGHALADHPHAEERDLATAQWHADLGEHEEDALKEAYSTRLAHNRQTYVLRENIERLQNENKRMVASCAALTVSLAAMYPELTEHAVKSRKETVASYQEKAVLLTKAVQEARATLATHEESWRKANEEGN